MSEVYAQDNNYNNYGNQDQGNNYSNNNSGNNNYANNNSGNNNYANNNSGNNSSGNNNYSNNEAGNNGYANNNSGNGNYAANNSGNGYNSSGNNYGAAANQAQNAGQVNDYAANNGTENNLLGNAQADYQGNSSEPGYNSENQANSVGLENAGLSNSNYTEGANAYGANVSEEEILTADEGTVGADGVEGTEAGQSINSAPPNSINLDPIPEPNDFAGVPPVPGTLRSMADGEAPTQYTIQEGDTLFDICDQLLDESTYWPKLWSLNPDIKNPHFIWPGMVLRFYSGDELLPPFLEVENENDLVPIDRGGLSESDLVKAPLPEKELDPVYVIDPIEVIDITQVEVSDDDYMYVGTPRVRDHIDITVPVFVFSEEQEEAAVFIGGSEGEINLGVGQRGIVEVEEGVSAGQTYSVIRFTEEIENPLNGDFVGYRYQNAGTVKVEYMIEDGDRAVVKVLTTEYGIQKGDQLVGYKSSVRRIPIAGNLRTGPAADSTIVSFGIPYGNIASQGQYVVFDNPSLSVGSNVGLFRAPVEFGNVTDSEYIPNQLENVGVARIVDSTDAASVGIILYATTALVAGDRSSPENIMED
jgi:nucleoid-associated protein YgaU